MWNKNVRETSSVKDNAAIGQELEALSLIDQIKNSPNISGSCTTHILILVCGMSLKCSYYGDYGDLSFTALSITLHVVIFKFSKEIFFNKLSIKLENIA
jgi:hypothetical protein